jgi:hypothetical protein
LLLVLLQLLLTLRFVLRLMTPNHIRNCRCYTRHRARIAIVVVTANLVLSDNVHTCRSEINRVTDSPKSTPNRDRAINLRTQKMMNNTARNEQSVDTERP